MATHGILFAVNSARIRPESTPTLEEIGEMLQDHPDLRLSIEGHTDSDGDETHNQTWTHPTSNRREWEKAHLLNPTTRRRESSRTGAWNWCGWTGESPTPRSALTPRIAAV